MKKLITLAALAIFSVSSLANIPFKCEATKRTQDARGSVVEVSKELTQVTPGIPKLTVDIDEAYFSFSQTGPNSFPVMITLGPDYQTGSMSNGSFNDQGKLMISRISPDAHYILNCEVIQ